MMSARSSPKVEGRSFCVGVNGQTAGQARNPARRGREIAKFRQHVLRVTAD
jgi:hypothetical protein